MRSFAVVGTDFHRVPLAELERVSARSGGAAALVERLCAALRDGGRLEAAALVTCNRVEVYVAAERELPADEIAHAWSAAVGAPAFARVGLDAERHLLRVACS